MWDINKDCNQVRKIIYEAHKDYITGVTYNADREEFATCAADGSIHVWKFGTWNRVHTFKGHESEVTKWERCMLHCIDQCRVLWSAGCSCWVSGSQDGLIHLWDPDTGELRSYLRSMAGITAMCIDENCGYLVIATTDHVIRTIDMVKVVCNWFLLSDSGCRGAREQRSHGSCECRCVH